MGPSLIWTVKDAPTVTGEVRPDLSAARHQNIHRNDVARILVNYSCQQAAAERRKGTTGERGAGPRAMNEPTQIRADSAAAEAAGGHPRPPWGLMKPSSPIVRETGALPRQTDPPGPDNDDTYGPNSRSGRELAGDTVQLVRTGAGLGRRIRLRTSRGALVTSPGGRRPGDVTGWSAPW